MTCPYLWYHCVFLLFSRWRQAGGRPSVITLPCARDSIRLREGRSANLLCLCGDKKKPGPGTSGAGVLNTASSEMLRVTHLLMSEAELIRQQN